MNSRTFLAITIASAALTLSGWVLAGGTPTSTAITYQGQLKTGSAPADGVFDLEFRLFDVPTGGAALGTVAMPDYNISDGLVTAALDFGTSMFDGSERWLEIQVDATSLTPRQRIAAAPYALYALDTGAINIANLPPGGTWALASGLNLDAGTVYVDPANNRVGIGTSTPATALDVAGTARMSGFQLPTGAGAGKVLRSDGGGAGSWQNDGLTLPFSATMFVALDPAFEVINNNTGPAIVGRANIPGSTYAIVGEATNLAGVRGTTTGGGSASAGVEGEASHATGRGVRGIALSFSGFNFGGHFTSFSNSGVGAYGEAAAISGNGIGGQFKSRSENGRGVEGYALSTASGLSYGGYFQNSAPSGIGALGLALHGSGANFGVWGQSNSTAGVGVRGQAAAASGSAIGVYGETASSTGYAGYFQGGRNYFSGSVGIGTTAPSWPLHIAAAEPVLILQDTGSASTQSGYVTFWNANPTETAWMGFGTPGSPHFTVINARSGGNLVLTHGSGGVVHVNGTLTKNAGSFKIDHPLDPANKYLSHSFVESPDMMNIYNGNARTDGAGYATITLPEWFEVLNRDFRYQLTVIDEADSDHFVLAKVVQEVKGNAFRIRTSVPFTHVSWQVTGIRHDPYAEAHRIPVEEQKPDDERGLYQHPELYGQPRAMSLFHRPESPDHVAPEASHDPR